VAVTVYFSLSVDTTACCSLQRQCWNCKVPSWEWSWCQHQRWLWGKWRRPRI